MPRRCGAFLYRCFTAHRSAQQPPNLTLWNGPLRIPVSAGEPRWAGFLCGKGSFQRRRQRHE
ncbi:hypothetical protein [Enterobacteria phage UAB_Phi20]|uniref:hypothetical protein n=1 Tax=Enterobacteria phage UAB_Phi20 TaxID=876449 RepID=UPI0002B2881E|nr:hypothetical protein [Enterobacteria phage UAB_Phi20]ADW81929.1 hypothetical protein [Enterobacteria phage UAB_Phi20]